MPHPHLVAGATLLCVCGLSAQSTLTQFGETVLASGDFMPGFPAGAVVATTAPFLAPSIDRNGTLVFRAKAATSAGLGIDTTNDAAIYVGRTGGSLRLVARAGTQAPGCPAGTLLRTGTGTPSNGLNGNPRISPTGEHLLFRSALYDPTNPGNTPSNADSALFFGTAANPQLLAREGDLVPFLTSSERWGQLDFAHQTHKLNSAGTVLFQHVLRTGGSVNSSNDSLLVLGTASNLQVILREGSPWPGSGNQEVVSALSALVQLNESGAVLHELQFVVGSGTVPVTANNDRSLAVWANGTDTIIAREGQQAPGLPTGVVFTDVSTTLGFHNVQWAAFNSSGNTVFRAALSGGGTRAGIDDRALYLAGTGGLFLVARTDDAAPGLLGVRLGTFADGTATIDERNRVLFSSTLTGNVTPGDDSAVWLGVPGTITALAREGDAVPDLPASTNGPWRYVDLSNAVAWSNELGHIVLPVLVSDGVATKEVWLGFTPTTGVRLLVDTSEPWTTPLGTGAITATSFVGVANSSDGGASWFNHQGDVVLSLTLTTTPTPLGSAMVRTHVGSLQAAPGSVAAIGGQQFFEVDATTRHAGALYLIVGTLSGTRPGFAFSGQHVPLNQDTWLTLSILAANSPAYPTSFGLLDGQGRASSSLLLPPGLGNLAGAQFHHAVVLFHPTTLQASLVSEPVSLELY